MASDRLDLEVKRDEAENERLQVLYKVVEDTETFRVRRLRHVVDRADLSRLERNVIIPNSDLQLLPPVLILSRPFSVILLQNLAFLHNPLDLVNNQGAHKHLFADKAVIPVVGVVGVARSGTTTIPDNSKVELEELVAEATLMARVVADIKWLVQV